jgi:hypothetical protein
VSALKLPLFPLQTVLFPGGRPRTAEGDPAQPGALSNGQGPLRARWAKGTFRGRMAAEGPCAGCRRRTSEG